jgi:hypothetical protein
MKHLFFTVIIIFIFLVSMPGLSQSDIKILGQFNKNILKSDSKLYNSKNRLEIYVSNDNKVYKDYNEREQFSIDLVCSLLEEEEFPLSIIVSYKSSVKMGFYRDIWDTIKKCRGDFYNRKSQENYSLSYSDLDDKTQAELKENYSISLYDSTY